MDFQTCQTLSHKPLVVFIKSSFVNMKYFHNANDYSCMSAKNNLLKMAHHASEYVVCF